MRKTNHFVNRRDFMKSVAGASVAPFLLSGDAAPVTDSAAIVTVHIDQRIGPIDPRIFGHFTEETLTSYEGGVSSEMLINRKFEMPEERGAKGMLFPGISGGWEPIGLAPGVTLVVDQTVYYSPTQSQRITYSGGDTPAGIEQRGHRYARPPLEDPFLFKPGERYRIRLAIKNRDLRGAVHVALGESYLKPVASHEFQFSGGEDWNVYQCELVASAEALDGKFMIYIDSPGTVWVDSVSLVRADLDDGGFRKDAVEVTRRFKPTCIRWPGGWFVSDYHWQDGIGPVDKRPARLNRAWLGYTTNDVGIDEFVALCRKLNAEPYVCVNVGTGTPEEAAVLVEYANGASDTRWGRVRAENGHPEPYHIKAWNVGNEEWHPPLAGARGKAYGETFEAYAKAMRAVDPSIELVAVGLLVEPPSGLIPPDHPARKMFRHLFNWNKEVLPIAGQSMSAYSIHTYEPTGEGFKGLSAAEISRAAMVSAEDLSAKLEVLYKQMREYAPGGKIFPVAPDEWSVGMPHEYVPPNVSAPPLPEEIKDPGQLKRYGSLLTLRAAVGEAAVYNLMQRRPKEFALANRVILYAYAMGIVGIGRDRVVASPPALNLELYSTYDRCESLSIETKGPTFDVAPRGDFKGAKGANVVDASARIGSDGKTLEVFLVNRDIEKDIDVMVRLSGGRMDGPVEMARLNAPSLTDWNSFENPDRVKIEHSQPAINHGELRILLPAHSISKLKVRLK